MEELVLGGELDAVPRARRFAAEAIAGDHDELSVDVQLVVTELVTNACLHGAEPVVVRLLVEPEWLRVEVEDAGRTVPVRMRQSTGAMTGRGLALVDALSTTWGVQVGDGGGKVVWAEFAGTEPRHVAERDVDADALLAAWRDEEPAEPRYPVRLGSVPTELLLEAKAHIDNVVRELTLVRADEAATGVSLPAPMAELVETVTEGFAEARSEIKRQALAAAERGDDYTDLELLLPVSAADAGERYLEALDQADRHARAARLLTLAPPRSHRAFREWYVRALVHQLRAASRGEVVAQPQPFPLLLADEIDRLDSLQESWERLQLLQRITAELTAALTVDAVGRIVVDNAADHPGVEAARVYVVSSRRTLVSVAKHGGTPGPDDYEEFSLDADLPGAVVARTGEAMFVRSFPQVQARFPELTGEFTGDHSLHVVPLRIRGRTFGVLALSFLSGELADEDQVSFVRAIADALAQAMDRIHATERAEAERGRELQLLTAQLDVLVGIVAGVPLTEALEDLLRSVEAASQDGMLGSVLLLDADGVHLRHGAAPSLPDFYNEAIDGIEIGPAVGSCGTAAYLREQVIVPDVTTDSRWDDFRDLAVRAGLRACWSTPILGSKGQLLGTFAMYYPRPRQPSRADLALIEVLVRTVAMAIERSWTDVERELALATESAAALTLQDSLLPTVPAAIGPVRLAARYRTGDPGVEVGGDWFDAVAVDGGTVLVVGDVQGHDLRAAALMGQLRTVARARAGEGHPPAAILAGMNRYLSRLVDTELMATALVVHLDATTGRATLASAGHLPPLMLRPDDGVWRADDVDLDVGPPLSIEHVWAERTADIPAGSVLLLYTDGLVETRSWPLDHGLALLRETLQALPGDADLDKVLDSALELVPTGSRGDDVAVLAAAVSG